MKNLNFKGVWRDYQKRVLDELETHLTDDNLHVVAAPGAGKTILGIEVMRRIGNPTLILAPSLSIRNQWIQRIRSMFLEENAPEPDWISTTLKDPKYLTVITYQALHTAFSGDCDDEESSELLEEESGLKKKTEQGEVVNVIDLLKKQQVQTLVLDEAHHLRKEWWAALTKLKKELKATSVVALTATPPYDVSFNEWNKYEELCGSIDAEISVPELVQKGDLCPHQDYVYFSLLKEKEVEKLKQFKGDISTFLEHLKKSSEFLNVLQSHPWVNDTKNNVEHILAEPKFFSSIIIFLNACGYKTPSYALNILGVNKSSIPNITPEWLEVLLTGVLYQHNEYLMDHKEFLDSIRKHLKRIGAIDRRKIFIDNTKEIQKLLASSLSKLDAIVDITQNESSYMGSELRMVILADFIRKSDLPTDVNDNRQIDKIGVVPIFEYLRRSKIENLKLGILTGSLVFVPNDSKEAIKLIAHNMNIDPNDIKFKKLAFDENYLSIDVKGKNKQYIVQVITEAFNQGVITTLVGTQALLGEGWDAPSINTLILASYVGSYMLSNQMRGRAIRIDPNSPNKSSNIWHLVAVDIETIEEKIQSMFTGKSNRRVHFSPFDEIQKDIGHDVKMLRRRFKAFEGLTFKQPYIIENGFRRLNLAKVRWTPVSVNEINDEMLLAAKNRHFLKSRWKSALQGSTTKPEMRTKLESNYTPKNLAFADTLKYMALNALIMGAAYGGQIFGGNRYGTMPRYETWGELGMMFLIALAIAAIYAFPQLVKALYLYIRNGSLEGSVNQVAYAVLDTLQFMELIKTNSQNIRLDTVKDNMGVVHCRLEGATAIENKHFMDAMKEVLGAVDDPRYLLIRNSYLGSLLRVDYHPIPKVIAQNKKNVLFFEKKWNRYVGESKFIYTRSIEGRKVLLKARTKSLASSFKKKSEQLSVWE